MAYKDKNYLPLLSTFLSSRNILNQSAHRFELIHSNKTMRTFICEDSFPFLIVMKTSTWGNYTQTKDLVHVFNKLLLTKINPYIELLTPLFWGKFIFGENIFVYKLPTLTITTLKNVSKIKTKDRLEIFKCCYSIAKSDHFLSEFDVGAFIKLSSKLQIYDLDLIHHKVTFINPRETHFYFNSKKEKFESKPFIPELLQDLDTLYTTYKNTYIQMFIKDVCLFLTQTNKSSNQFQCSPLCLLHFIDSKNDLHRSICLSSEILNITQTNLWDRIYTYIL